MVNKKDIDDLKTWIADKLEEQNTKLSNKIDVLHNKYDQLVKENKQTKTDHAKRLSTLEKHDSDHDDRIQNLETQVSTFDNRASKKQLTFPRT